jgi:Zinc carboxypeptidase.
MSYDQMKAAIADIKNSAKADRFVNLEVYGTTVQGRPMDLGIIAKDKEAVDKYLNETTPMMLENPEKMIADIKANKADYKTVIFMNNIHPDEQPGVDAVVKLFNDYAKEDFIDYATTDENGKKVNKRINVDRLLEDFILVFSFTQNPDGRVANTRTNANNLDLNRDNGFQTQPETQAMVAQISKYNPLIFLDYHGFVQEFLIEPCTPPHDPNYETDLLYSTMLELAHIMGRAGVENSKYEDYLIPMIDYGTGWDDATSAYTATYAMHHGALGHTIEVPEMNEDSFKAAIHTGYAAADYAINNKDMLMLNKLEYYKRGVEKLDSREADKAIVNAQNEIKGRPRGSNENFFPDYYVIPMGLDAQKNAVAAFDMVAYLERNGVKVHELKSDAGAYKKAT